MELEGVLAAIEQDGQLARRVTHWQRLAARPARFGDWPPGVDARLVAALGQRGIESPYSHQALGIGEALHGKNVVLVTPTASGKTLCYNVPVLNRLLAEPGARALYLFPTKALAQDQLAEMEALVAEIERVGRSGGMGAASAERPAGGGVGAASAERPAGGGVGAACAERPVGGGVGAACAERPVGGGVGAACAERPVGGGVGAASAERPAGGGVGAASAERPVGGGVGAASGGRGNRISVATYDGDTPQGRRAAIRRDAAIVISNPDMVHQAILPHHTRWASFFQGLRFVVLDEIHTYRGVFGSHVANVLRRLKRVCAFYGARPQFVCASATIGNPLELAERLVEEPFFLVDANQDGAPRGAKHILFYNPPLVDQELGIRRSAVTDVRLIAERFLAAEVQTIVFARARLTTEVLLTYLRDALGREQPGGLEGVRPEAGPGEKSQAPRAAALERVQGYRGGYLPLERRRIERGLRERQVLAVVATNALELGINIGHLDACIMAGYPGTIASTWQQAGRAGRRADTSAAILVAGSSPLDQYIISHPEYFFERSPERALLNPDNLVIAVNHVRCAAFELPFEEGETLGHFPHTAEVLAFLEQEGVVRQSGGRWHWSDQVYPAEAVSLRTAEMDNFVVVNMTGGDGAAIGLVDLQSAPSMIHEGAVYMHGGDAFLVRELDWEGRVARVEPAEVGYYTQASGSVNVEVLETYEEEVGATICKQHGLVLITSHATSFKKVRLYTHEILGWGDISPDKVPEQRIETTAYWFHVTEGTTQALESEGLLNMARDDRGPNWEAQRQLARERDGYRCRHCGAPERPDRGHDVHHVEPFRTFGYSRGKNDRYLAANRLENLVTLCRSCHRRVEVDRMVMGTLSALAHVVQHIAPLYLMCDPRDIGVVSEVKSPVTRLPTVTIYDNAPGGLGFSEGLYALHDTLLRGARELVGNCGCPHGCPSCVGPVLEVGEDAKENCLRLLDHLLAP